MRPTLNITWLTEEQFTLSRGQWSEILADSDADKLFSSWEWQHTWWHTYKSQLQATLALIVVENSEGVWQGVAPLYFSRKTYYKLVPSRILQPIGGCWRGSSNIVSEYLDVLVRNSEFAEAARSMILDAVFSSQDWDELVFPYIESASPTIAGLFKCSKEHNSIFHQADEKTAYRIKSTKNIEEYKAGLSANARRSMFGDRTRICNVGQPELRLAKAAIIDEFMVTLAALHKARFGRSVLGGTTTGFFKSLAAIDESDITMFFSTISCDGRIVSMTLDIEVQGTVYNLQGGFDCTSTLNSASLGLVHIGMNVEAYARLGYRVYDLLAGGGRSNPTYKASISNSSVDLLDVRIFRGELQKMLYKLRPALWVGRV